MTSEERPAAPASALGRLAAWFGFGAAGSSFRRRLVSVAALLGTTAAVLLVVVIQVTLSRSSYSAVEKVLNDRAEAVISSAEAVTVGGRLAVPGTRMDPGVAVYTSTGVLVAGVVPPSQTGVFAALSRVRSPQRRDVGGAFAVLAEPFTTATAAHGVVVVSEPLDSYQDIVHDALASSVGIGAALVVLTTILVAWTSRRALAPVARMAQTAEAWSEHDLDRRFDLGPATNEIQALGHTLDRLLDRVRRAILDEQRLTSELAHELRTPLTAVLATAEIIADRDDLDADLRDDLGAIAASCRQMADTVTGLVELARSAATGARDDDADLAAVVDGLLRDLPGGERVRVALPEGLRAAVTPVLGARALAPVLENAIRHGQHVDVTGVRRQDDVVLLIADDGPGVAAADAEVIFVPGHTGSGGSGLGLALARRVARSVGGEVSLRAAVPDRGATFEVRLPASSPAGERRSP